MLCRVYSYTEIIFFLNNPIVQEDKNKILSIFIYISNFVNFLWSYNVFAGIDDEEIDTYILTKEEVDLKTRFWMKLNGEHLKEMERR